MRSRVSAATDGDASGRAAGSLARRCDRTQTPGPRRGPRAAPTAAETAAETASALAVDGSAVAADAASAAAAAGCARFWPGVCALSVCHCMASRCSDHAVLARRCGDAFVRADPLALDFRRHEAAAEWSMSHCGSSAVKGSISTLLFHRCDGIGTLILTTHTIPPCFVSTVLVRVWVALLLGVCVAVLLEFTELAKPVEKPHLTHSHCSTAQLCCTATARHTACERCTLHRNSSVHSATAEHTAVQRGNSSAHCSTVQKQQHLRVCTLQLAMHRESAAARAGAPSRGLDNWAGHS